MHKIGEINSFNAEPLKYFPLVSAGIPTWQRRKGLERTLQLLIAQDYPNLEIVVSYNGPFDKAINEVISKIPEIGGKLRMYWQDKNIGMHANFQFVLRQARGIFFFWAADDDEWEPSFVSSCVAQLLRSNAAAVMPSQILVRNRFNGLEETVAMPELSGNPYLDSRAFINKMSSNLIYGVFKRRKLLWFLEVDQPFDWIDCYIVLRTILNSGGYMTFSSKPLYVAGIDSPEYVYKPYSPKKGRVFSYRGFLFKGLISIVKAETISIAERLSLLRIFVINRTSDFSRYEKKYSKTAQLIDLALIIMKYFGKK